MRRGVRPRWRGAGVVLVARVVEAKRQRGRQTAWSGGGVVDRGGGMMSSPGGQPSPNATVGSVHSPQPLGASKSKPKPKPKKAPKRR